METPIPALLCFHLVLCGLRLVLRRNDNNRWAGLGAVFTRDSVVAEGHNMSSLGADHADKKRWTGLELPFPDFMLNARLVLTRCVKASRRKREGRE